MPVLPLGHDLWLEGGVAVPRHVDPDRPDLSGHRLGPHTVAGVPATRTSGIVLVIAEVVDDLTFQRRLQHPLGQLLQQTILT
jgi:hypothetical protein